MNTILIHNVETGEIIEREMTQSELSQLEADKQIAQLEIEKKNELLKKRLLAIEKLKSLGLSNEDLSVLGFEAQSL